jgi:metal-dependent hydrolase (beta-lactamase superfamily II)
MPAGEKAFELVVLSHVDSDHVEGLVRLFAEKPLPVTVRKVWFNGWRQINPKHTLLGAVQGDS